MGRVSTVVRDIDICDGTLSLVERATASTPGCLRVTAAMLESAHSSACRAVLYGSGDSVWEAIMDLANKTPREELRERLSEEASRAMQEAMDVCK